MAEHNTNIELEALNLSINIATSFEKILIFWSQSMVGSSTNKIIDLFYSL